MQRNGNRVEFFVDANRQWRFRRIGANNEIMAQSEGYMQLTDAQNTADEIFESVPWFVKNEEEEWEQVR